MRTVDQRALNARPSGYRQHGRARRLLRALGYPLTTVNADYARIGVCRYEIGLPVAVWLQRCSARRLSYLMQRMQRML